MKYQPVLHRFDNFGALETLGFSVDSSFVSIRRCQDDLSLVAGKVTGLSLVAGMGKQSWYYGNG